ncbi:glycosyl transferase [Amycolatopsis antarctica]|uniref:Glycosyl transferase n=1 Tax=Amycolatopsis antarctica TaxID=1854586 RepID=A0A263D072_9PSEU|nr:glycosyltransferase [Amycolatopsis antarctica]OZM71844.1 glycosyl transferase [Amycolatopsis antarctica]
MRVLLTCLPLYSHLVPAVIPAARALGRAGHQVAVATAPAMAGELGRAGIEHLPLPNVIDLARFLTDPAYTNLPGMPGAVTEAGGHRSAAAEPSVSRARSDPGEGVRAYAGPLARIFAEDLLDAAPRWQPDVIVRECNEFGGYLAAERLGLPQAVLDISPFSARNLPAVRDILNAQRAGLGLDTVDTPGRPDRTLLAALVPQQWYPDDIRLPSARSYRLDDTGPGAIALDPAFANLPDDRPLVLAGLGTVALQAIPEAPKLLELLVAALGELPCTGVVALGPGFDPADWTGPRPGNVRLTSFAPQPQLLHSADLFLSHGGFGGVREALRAGTPMAVLPLFGDQQDNADRVAELGLGTRLDPAVVDATSLAEACARLLDDPAPRHRAASMSRRMLACPGTEALAEDIAALA